MDGEPDPGEGLFGRVKRMGTQAFGWFTNTNNPPIRRPRQLAQRTRKPLKSYSRNDIYKNSTATHGANTSSYMADNSSAANHYAEYNSRLSASQQQHTHRPSPIAEERTLKRSLDPEMTMDLGSESHIARPPKMVRQAAQMNLTAHLTGAERISFFTNSSRNNSLLGNSYSNSPVAQSLVSRAPHLSTVGSSNPAQALGGFSASYFADSMRSSTAARSTSRKRALPVDSPDNSSLINSSSGPKTIKIVPTRRRFSTNKPKMSPQSLVVHNAWKYATSPHHDITRLPPIFNPSIGSNTSSLAPTETHSESESRAPSDISQEPSRAHTPSGSESDGYTVDLNVPLKLVSTEPQNLPNDIGPMSLTPPLKRVEEKKLWTCQVCMLNNRMSNENCCKCGSRRQPACTENQWICTACARVNEGFQTNRCSNCGVISALPEKDTDKPMDVLDFSPPMADVPVARVPNLWGDQFKVKADEWTCGGCLVVNKISFSFCPSCGAAKDKGTAAAQESDSSTTAKLSVVKTTPAVKPWQCYKCFKTNKTEVCIYCPAPRDDLAEAERPKTWRCKKCFTDVKAHLDYCSSCASLRSDAPPLPEAYTRIKIPVKATESSTATELPKSTFSFGASSTAPVLSATSSQSAASATVAPFSLGAAVSAAAANGKPAVATTSATGGFNFGAILAAPPSATSMSNTPATSESTKIQFNFPGATTSPKATPSAVPTSPIKNEDDKKDQKPKATLGWGDQFKAKDGEWPCPMCAINNKAADMKCACCEERNPKAPPLEKPAYSFGFPAAATTSSTSAPAPTFGFGTTTAAADTGAKPNFSFGAPPKADSTGSPSKKPAFGATAASSTPAGAALTFSFGQPASSTGEKKPTFSFGSTKPETTATEAPKIDFNFGAAATTASAEPPKSGFNFGAAISTATFGQSSAVPAPAASSTGFSFGQSSAAATTASTGGFSFGTAVAAAPTTAAAAPTISFGSAAAPTSSTGFTFGGSAAATKPSTGFSFGQSNGQAAFAANATKTAFNATASVKSFAAEATKNAFAMVADAQGAKRGFGATTDPAAESSKPAFSFGGASSGGFSFGGSAKPAEAATAPAFGQSNGIFGQANGDMTDAKPTAGFSFGQAAAVPSEPAKPGFSFGQPAAAAPASTGFSFGAATTAQSSGFNFGGAAAAPAPSFGQPPDGTPTFGQPPQQQPQLINIGANGRKISTARRRLPKR